MDEIKMESNFKIALKEALKEEDKIWSGTMGDSYTQGIVKGFRLGWNAMHFLLKGW